MSGDSNFRAIEQVGPKVREAARLLVQAGNVLADAPEPRFDRIADGLARARDEISAASSTVAKGVALLDGLPGLLGEDGTRRYFLAFQSPSEIRGTGGFPGVYGVLTADHGAAEARPGPVDRNPRSVQTSGRRPGMVRGPLPRHRRAGRPAPGRLLAQFPGRVQGVARDVREEDRPACRRGGDDGSGGAGRAH